MALRTIQAGLFLRVYKLQCPGDDEVTTDNDILIGILIQMARFHGLHRNAVELDKGQVDVHDRYLWKKIWTQLLYLDAMQSFTNRTTLLIPDDEFDNLVSAITHIDSMNLQIEDTFITRHFALKYMTTKLTRKIILITSQMQLCDFDL